MVNHKLFIYTLRSLPNFLWPLKKVIIKSALKKCGKSVKIGSNVFILNPNLVKMGDYVFIGDWSSISANVNVSIGNYVMFGPEVMIRGGDHNFSEIGRPMRFVKTGGKNLPITIEDDVWIGARVTILKGVNVGEGAVIGAASVVTKNILPYTINVGSPAKPIKTRFTKTQMIHHLRLVFSNYSIEKIIDMYQNNNITFDE